MTKPEAIKKILITRTDRLGDLVLSTPVFSALKAENPQLWIAALSFQENREVLEGNPFVDEVILYDKKGSEKGLWGQGRFALKIAKKKFDAVIHLHATHRMHWMAWLARVPVRIGWKRKSSWALTHAFPDIKKEGAKHESEYNFELFKEWGVSPEAGAVGFFPVPDRARKSLESLLAHLEIPRTKQWVAVSPGASCPSKRWPAASFGDAMNLLLKKEDVFFLGIGSPSERALLEEAGSHLASTERRFWNLAGLLSLSTLGALLSQCRLLISNDSGPVHVASAVGTPSVAIFGRDQAGLSPVRWKPLHPKAQVLWKKIGCDPCLAHGCKINFLCLDAILPEEVANAAGRALEQ